MASAVSPAELLSLSTDPDRTAPPVTSVHGMSANDNLPPCPQFGDSNDQYYVKYNSLAAALQADKHLWTAVAPRLWSNPRIAMLNVHAVLYFILTLLRAPNLAQHVRTLILSFKASSFQPHDRFPHHREFFERVHESCRPCDVPHVLFATIFDTLTHQSSGRNYKKVSSAMFNAQVAMVQIMALCPNLTHVELYIDNEILGNLDGGGTWKCLQWYIQHFNSQDRSNFLTTTGYPQYSRMLEHIRFVAKPAGHNSEQGQSIIPGLLPREISRFPLPFEADSLNCDLDIMLWTVEAIVSCGRLQAIKLTNATVEDAILARMLEYQTLRVLNVSVDSSTPFNTYEKLGLKLHLGHDSLEGLSLDLWPSKVDSTPSLLLRGLQQLETLEHLRLPLSAIYENDTGIFKDSWHRLIDILPESLKTLELYFTPFTTDADDIVDRHCRALWDDRTTFDNLQAITVYDKHPDKVTQDGTDPPEIISEWETTD